LLQPWFLPQRIAFAIHGLLPKDCWNKMRYVFDDYGCLICGKGVDYHSNGMCHKCYATTRGKILKSVRRRAADGRRPRLDLELFRQEKLAKKLLARFAINGMVVPQKPRFLTATNPVYEALASRFD
jgi:hypothetical protein